MSVLLVSFNWPKFYVSTVVIEIDDQNILTPLLEGSAIATSIKNIARNAEQLIYSGNSMDKIMEVLNEETKFFSKKRKEELWDDIKGNALVKKYGRNILKISYRSKDPIRAQLIADNMSRIFISESVAEKRRESESAYSFIENQASEYHKKLLYAETALKEFRSNNLGADPGSSAVVNARILELQRSIEQSSLDINEAKIRMENIDAQLSGEVELAAHLTREGQLQERINTLQFKLDTLRMTYLDTYPDIIIIKDQILSLKHTMNNVSNEEPAKIIQNGSLNPLLQELRARRSQFTTELAALRTRVVETKQLLSGEMSRARQINNAVAIYAKLTRDYEGNQELYETLLKKRENARVSMNIDIANQGMTLKIKEKAKVPVRPVGIRFVHFALIGIIGAIIAPFGLAFFIANLSSSLKTISEIKGLKIAPVLGSIGTYRNTGSDIFNIAWLLAACLITLLIFAAYGYVGWLKIMGMA
jgi:polysaccharide chain length determinant protein, PEP-CTERM locus subfamily